MTRRVLTTLLSAAILGVVGFPAAPASANEETECVMIGKEGGNELLCIDPGGGSGPSAQQIVSTLLPIGTGG